MSKPITAEQLATLKNCLMNVIDSKLDNQAKLRGILKHFDDYGSMVRNQAFKEVLELVEDEELKPYKGEYTKEIQQDRLDIVKRNKFRQQLRASIKEMIK